MFLVELFIPLSGNDGQRFPRKAFEELERLLTDHFGGLTSYPRAPASGIWNDASGSVRDELVVYEVMTERLDKRWWEHSRKRLEEQFHQEKVLIRATEIIIL